jgi:hypothetical protein
MIEHSKSPESFVYHYTKAATARDFILKDWTLQFSSYTRTNDPKETKAWEFGLITFEDRDLAKYRHSQFSAEFSQSLKSTAKLACFSMDAGPLSGNHVRDIYRRGYAKARMWAQYSDRHTGVCLVLDKEKLLASARERFRGLTLAHGKVAYRDAPLLTGIEHHAFNIDVDLYESLGPSAYLRSHLQRHGQTLFFEKLNDWRDEHEWRIVVFSDSTEDLYLQVQDSLVAVVHGDATDPDTSEVLMELTKQTKIEHLGLSWKNGAPWYDYASFGWLPGKVTKPRRRPSSVA